MNAFASAAEAASVDTPAIPKLSPVTLVSYFLAGRDGASDDFTSVGGVLSEGSTTLARICPNGDVLLGMTGTSDVEFNDALIGGLALSGRKYRRVAGFGDLLNPVSRLSDLDTGKVESFASIASLFGFDYTQAEIESLQLAKSFRARVSEFFTKRNAEEQARIKAERDREARERVKREAVSWDSGDGMARNSRVTGSGGGQRLRVRKSTVGSRSVRVETSQGQNLTLKQAQRAWEFATQYWHGDKRLHGSAYLGPKSYGGHRTQVYDNRLHFGCQNITRREAERFAASQGWPQAVKTGA